MYQNLYVFGVQLDAIVGIGLFCLIVLVASFLYHNRRP